jgi:hypothetical protein
MLAVSVTGRAGPAGLERAEGVLQLLHRAVGHQKQPLALGGEVDRAVGPLEQLDPQGRLQPVDLPAHRRLGEEQILRGEGDAHAPPHGDKAAQELDRGILASGTDILCAHVKRRKLA